MKKTAQLLMFCSGVLLAQTTPPAIQTFSQETTLPFSHIGISGSPNIPANILSSVSGGALEVRQLVDLMSGNRLRIRHILVQPGAPNPTPSGTQNAVVEDYIVRIEDTVQTSDPATVTYIGTVDQLNASSPFVGRAGGPFIYSIAWEGTPRKFTSATLVIPGRLATWAGTSTGTLLLTGETAGGGGTPGGTTNQPPTVSIAGAPRIVTSQPEFLLDASGSKDPGNTALTYSWRVVRGAASIINPTSAQARAQFGGNADDYVFEVTVTNAGGLKATGTLTVFYTGRF